MSNIAGKAYAMNVVTAMKSWRVPLNRAIFWLAKTRIFQPRLLGLLTLSLIHYARWVILRDRDFPRLSPEQPEEKLAYGYMLFCSNFNGSWEQYVDSFSSAIPEGLDLLWTKNLGWPLSVPMQPFHHYITRNQVWTNHYYNAYPMASSNDVKAAQRVRERLLAFVREVDGLAAAAFFAAYQQLLFDLQHDLNVMSQTPIVSLASAAVEQRRVESWEALALTLQGRTGQPVATPPPT